MNELLKKAFALGLGATIASKEKIQQVVDELVVKGELEQNESKDLLSSLLAKGEEQRDHIKQMVQDQVKKVLDELQIATKQDLKELEIRLNQSAAAGTAHAAGTIIDPQAPTAAAGSIILPSSAAAPSTGTQPDPTGIQSPIIPTQNP